MLRKNVELPKRLLVDLKLEAVKNETTLYALAGEILEHYLEADVPHIALDESNRVRTQLDVDETTWEQVRSLAHKNGVGIYRAFEEAAAHLGYSSRTNV